MSKISIKVYFYENFRHIAGKDSEIITCEKETSLEDFVKNTLAQKYGENFTKLALDDKGDICRILLTLVNGKIIKGAASFKLSDKDEVALLLPVAGG